MSADPQKQRYKRKRKNNFLINAKGYGKKGMYGRGTQLDEGTYHYFIRVLELYKKGLPSEEEKLSFANNVLLETQNEEIKCCCNQVGCRVVQTLLPLADDTHLKRYMEVLLVDLRPLCSDPFASHVLQTLTEIACQKYSANDTDDDFKECCRSTIIKISKFLLNNLEDYIWDVYGNHILRTVLKNLVTLEGDEYKCIVKEYGTRLISWPQFNDLPYSELTSGFLQVLLNALGQVDTKLLETYLSKLLTECFTNITEIEGGSSEALPDAFMSKPMIMLLESYIENATPKLFTQIYAKCFISKLQRLSKMKNTTFAVQKLLNKCVEKSEFEAMFDELSEHFPEIIDIGHTDVIVALGQGCKRLSAKQGAFVKNIMQYYDCSEPEANQLDIVLCLCKNVKRVNLKENKDVDLQNAKLNLHGTLIVQLILEFNKPIKFINSIINIHTNDLKKLFCNRMGCHIVDSFVQSKYVGEKSREKLFKKLQGTYQDLARDKYGSRGFEAIWNAASLKHKKAIMEELAYKDGSWSNTQFGKIISFKINLQLYKRNKAYWNDYISNTDSKADPKKMFADIIG